MKKILTLVSILGLSFSLHSQGLVSIQESSFIITTNSTAIGGTSGNMVSGTTSPSAYFFALLTIQDPTGSTTLPTISSASDLLSSWFLAGVSGTNATGINAGKIAATPATTGVAANSWAAGSTNFTVVVGWSANEGSSWNTISNSISSGIWANTTTAGVFGWSVVGYGASTSLTPAFSVFGNGAGQINSGFVLTQVAAVPEPGTLALAALGGASLLLFRRRKV